MNDNVGEGERAVVIAEWPQPNAGAPIPQIIADDTSLIVRYYTSAETIAIVHFSLCTIHMFGAPNDEALGGHPLIHCGLKFYSVHRVENSSWIDRLERQNSIHPNHDKERFLEDKQHYIFTFHDSTLECVVTEGQFFPTEVFEFNNEIDADKCIQAIKSKEGHRRSKVDTTFGPV